MPEPSLDEKRIAANILIAAIKKPEGSYSAIDTLNSETAKKDTQAVIDSYKEILKAVSARET